LHQRRGRDLFRVVLAAVSLASKPEYPFATRGIEVRRRAVVRLRVRVILQLLSKTGWSEG
jgi:hypothetical protein